MKEKVLGVIDRKNYEKEWPQQERIAVRGLIEKDGKYALIYSRKYGDYKFPGGGMEQGETREETLLREVEEETGLLVLPASIRYFGKTIEYKKGKKNGICLEQISHYYFCQVSEELGACNLDEYEKRFGYELAWMPLAEAVEVNDIINTRTELPWQDRDTYIMRLLL